MNFYNLIKIGQKPLDSVSDLWHNTPRCHADRPDKPARLVGQSLERGQEEEPLDKAVRLWYNQSALRQSPDLDEWVLLSRRVVWTSCHRNVAPLASLSFPLPFTLDGCASQSDSQAFGEEDREGKAGNEIGGSPKSGPKTS
jgi:hypothetical protein